MLWMLLLSSQDEGFKYIHLCMYISKTPDLNTDSVITYRGSHFPLFIQPSDPKLLVNSSNLARSSFLTDGFEFDRAFSISVAVT